MARAVAGGCYLQFWVVNHPLPRLSSPLSSRRTGAVPQQHWDVLGSLEPSSALLLFGAGRAWMQQPLPGAPSPPRRLSWSSHVQVGMACRPAGIVAMPGPVLLQDAWHFRASIQLIRSSQPLFGTKAWPCAPSPPSSAASGSEKLPDLVLPPDRGTDLLGGTSWCACFHPGCGRQWRSPWHWARDQPLKDQDLRVSLMELCSWEHPGGCHTQVAVRGLVPVCRGAPSAPVSPAPQCPVRAGPVSCSS